MSLFENAIEPATTALNNFAWGPLCSFSIGGIGNIDGSSRGVNESGFYLLALLLLSPVIFKLSKRGFK